jgi:hypothetical protein
MPPKRRDAGGRMMTQKDTAILIRTHYWDDELAAFVETLRASLPYDIYVLTDESQGAPPPLPYPKFGLTKDFPARLGLLDQFPQVTWRCGDYFLYLARQNLPGYRFYWMLDHDIRIHFQNPRDFFRIFEQAEDVGLIACGYGPADQSWDWYKTLPGPDPVYRCAYSIVRLSDSAIDTMLSERQTLAKRFAHDGRDPTTWPNDEAFTATALTAKGVSCRDVNSFGHALYRDGTFNFWRPEALSAVRASRPDNMIHHPVLHGIHLFNKWMSIAYCTKSFDFDWFADHVRALIGQEWSAEQSAYLIEHAYQMRAKRQGETSGTR